MALQYQQRDYLLRFQVVDRFVPLYICTFPAQEKRDSGTLKWDIPERLLAEAAEAGQGQPQMDGEAAW